MTFPEWLKVIFRFTEGLFSKISRPTEPRAPEGACNFTKVVLRTIHCTVCFTGHLVSLDSLFHCTEYQTFET